MVSEFESSPVASSRFAPQPSVEPRSRFTNLTSTVKKGARLALSGKAFTAAVLPNVDEDDIERLPGIAKFAIDNLLSPVGLASLVLAPVTGGGSVAARFGVNLAAKPLAVRAGVDLTTRIASDLAIAGIGTAAAKGADKLLEDANPTMRTLGSIAAGIAAGGVAGNSLAKAFKPSVATRNLNQALFEADKALPDAPDIVRNAASMASTDTNLGPLTKTVQGIYSAVDPSHTIRTTIGKLHVSSWQAKHVDNDRLANIWIASKHSDLPDAFMVDSAGNALVQGKRVPWREARDNYAALTDRQKNAFNNFNLGIEDTVTRINKLTDDVNKHLSVDDLWVPKYVKGKVVMSGRPQFRDIEDIAVRNRFTKSDLERPETVLYLYGKAALDKEVDYQLEQAMKPFLLEAEKTFASTPEGAKLFDEWQRSLKSLDDYKLTRNFQAKSYGRSIGEGPNFGRSSTARGSKLKFDAGARRSDEFDITETDWAKGLAPFEPKKPTIVEVRRQTRSNSSNIPTVGRGATRSQQAAARQIESQADKAMFQSLKDAENTASKAWQKYKAESGLEGITPYQGEFVLDKEGGLDEFAKWVARLRGSDEAIPGLTVAQQTADLSRFLQASLDASGMFINSLPMLFNDPKSWAKGLAANWRTITYDKNFLPRYLGNEDNYRVASTMIKNGLLSGDMEQFVSASRGGLVHGAMNAPYGIGKAMQATFGRAQRGYEAGLAVARIEAWKALEGVPGFDERRIADFLRETTGAADTARMGVSPNQRAIESLIFFSPRLFRSSIALMADAVRPWTPEGALAAQTVLRMVGAGAGLFAVANAAIGELNGESDEQIAQRIEDSLNPIKGRQFMSLKIGDNWYGIGGQVRAIIQTIARASTNEDEKAGRDDNELWTFLNSRFGPASRAVTQLGEMATGDNWDPYHRIEAFPDFVNLQVAGLFPFYVQNAVSDDGLPITSKLLNTAVDIAGASSKPRTVADIRDSVAYKRFNTNWTNLTDAEQDILLAEDTTLSKRNDELLSDEDIQFRNAIEKSNSSAKEALINVNNLAITADAKRDRIQEVLRDRWVQNKFAYENFRTGEIGGVDSPKRRVVDAYFQTFDDSNIGANQTDWDKWEELQVDLQKRVAEGEFGDPELANRYLTERRKFALPPELKWYEDANAKVKASGYWEQKEVAFNELRSIINQRFPEIEDPRSLEYALENASTPMEAQSLKVLVNLLNKRTGEKRKVLKAKDPELAKSLKILGR